MKKISLILSLLASFIFCNAQNTSTVNIEFAVATPEKVPETGAEIKIYTEDKSFSVNGITDSDGKFKTTLPTGKDLKIDVYQYDTTFNFEQKIPDANYGDQYHPFSLSIKMTYTETMALNVHFKSNSHEIDETQTKDLDEFFKDLNTNKTKTVEIGAHTDNVGSDEYNRKLSLRRAKSIKAYLVSKGIKASRMTSKGYGEMQPKSTNETEEGRAENRRVEVKIISK